MQVIKNHCFLDECLDGKINIIIFDNDYNLIQYKLLDFNQSRLNNIYCGVVEKVDSSIESCFIRIDDNFSGFLPFKQFGSDYYDKSKNRMFKKVSKGDRVLVQIIRDSLHNKNVKLSNNISLAGKFCVYMPFNLDGHGISSSIKGDKRVLLKEYLKDLHIKGSIIIRSASVDAELNDISKDLKGLIQIYEEVYDKFVGSEKHGLLFVYNDLISNLRSYSDAIIDKIYLNKVELYQLLSQYKNAHLINLPKIIYGSNFDFLASIEKQVTNLYESVVYLPSNGYIVIEKTEAMITIDVNSGATTGIARKQRNMEETAFKTNLEAAKVIIDQIILRNLGGIITIDFIDMRNEDHIEKINEFIKSGFKNDRSSLKIIPMNVLCIVQISRERKGLSLFDKYYKICSTCNQGLVLSNNFLIVKLVQELSLYNYKEKLVVKLNKALLAALMDSKYQSVLKRYKSLSYIIIDSVRFKVSLDNSL